MPQNFSVNDLKWVEDMSEFNENFINRYYDEKYERYKVNVQYPENWHIFTITYPFLLKEGKLEKLKNLKKTCMTKKSILCT